MSTDFKRKDGQPGRIKKILLIAVSIIVVGGLGTACYFFYSKYQEVKKNPQVVSQQEVTYLTDKVSKLLQLPKDETPTVATVQDKEKLKDQPFFKDSQNGDKLLIYTKAQKAIIYRDAENRIINVGPIAIDSAASTNAKKTE